MARLSQAPKLCSTSKIRSLIICSLLNCAQKSEVAVLVTGSISLVSITTITRSWTWSKRLAITSWLSPILIDVTGLTIRYPCQQTSLCAIPLQPGRHRSL